MVGATKKTHPALTETALGISSVDSYLKSQIGLHDGILTDLYWDFPSDIKNRIEKGDSEPDKTTRSILDWIKTGSTIEDEDGRRWPHRPRHHFHDPIRDFGLENQTDHPNWENYACTWTGFDLTGESALHWAAVGTAWQEPITNDHYWGKAREEFYKALTESGEPVREESLAKALLNLGHILHLIEDVGVPAHSRNDFIEAHYRGIKSPLNFKDNPLEKWVEGQIKDNNDQSLWSGSGSVVFDKLAKYFDTDTRDPNGYLGDGVSPPYTWGLSEQTNYQFLSKSTMFKENVIINEETGERTKYYFPQPDVNNVTGYVKPDVYYWNSAPVHYRYISGYGITHLARNNFIEMYSTPVVPYPVVTVAYHTTFDEAVYEDYADITIPRTIDYTTGLINYFFRGSLDVSIGCPQGCNPSTNSATYSMTITNTSINTDREQVLKGGTFEFYWEDLSGNRTEANDFTVYTYDEFDPNTTELWDQNSILPYGEYIRATASFNVPSCTDIENYAIVYKGAINDFEYPDDTDFSDPNAIACWVKSESNSVPASSYTLLVTDWGGTDEYYECAEYLKTIFDSENPDGYTLAKTPDSTCFDCRWRFMDYHTCPYGSPYCYTGCNVIQIMLINSAATDEFCVIITPFPVAYCGFGPLCNGSYKRCFSKQPEERYDDFWERLFNGGVFGDGSETDCIEDGCIIPAFGTWTDSWVRVIWIANP